MKAEEGQESLLCFNLERNLQRRWKYASKGGKDRTRDWREIPAHSINGGSGLAIRRNEELTGFRPAKALGQEHRSKEGC